MLQRDPAAELQTAVKLLENVARMSPELDQVQLFRACHLLSVNGDAEPTGENLETLWREISMRLQAASDQQAAVTEELEALAATDPRKFNPEQVWILVKAIKVLSQLLSFYTREPQ